MHWKKTLLICCAILLFGGAATTLIFSTEPTAQRTGATQQTAMLVDVIEVQRGTYEPTIRAMGTVMPSQDITLSPRVSGQVMERSPNFTPGGYVEKGETLLQLDPSDYENTLQQRESDLSQAMSDLKIEMGRQNVAQQDYQLLSDTLSEENRELVLREPQLEAARSEVQSARAAVQQAELDLERTTIKAPFDAHILSRNVNVGSQVAPGDNLGRLVGLDTYWVEATVPLSQLRWLSFPSDRDQGSEVRIINRTAWDEGEYRLGHLFRLVGSLENKTRMARVLITVRDPQSYQTGNTGLPRLIIGSFVESNIKADAIANVFRLNRDYLRQNDTVWVMEDGELSIRDVDIVFRDAEYAYIRGGLNEQDQVVTTNLSTVTDGAPLRLQGSGDSETEQDSVQTDIQ
ncbi:efflux RND transporter periplasmic adaptor subunit [Halalkalibaculum sp. DA3122]|uniref:efflux RND transporter periplasmic adaptor subunit n=1 Tax=unclassified Halalkalibaculum TaxID=2964617 RepID=UPI003754C602